MEEQIERRRLYTPDQKFKIVKEHLTTKSGVTETCKKHGISSANFYRWLEEFYLGAQERLKNGNQVAASAELRRIEELTRQNDRFKTVIAEMSYEVVSLKKTLRE
jgi:transposase